MQNREIYYQIVSLYDEIKNGVEATSVYGKIGKIIKDYKLDKGLCDLILKSEGIRSIIKGFHDEGLVYVNFDKCDCQIVLYDDCSGKNDCNCPYKRFKFEDVTYCSCESSTDFIKENLYCQSEDISLLPDGNILIAFTFGNFAPKTYTPRYLQIICKDVSVSVAFDFI